MQSKSLTVISTLANLIQPMLGPYGRDVLLETTDTNTALITGSGHILLTNVLNVNATTNKSNAIATYLLQQLNHHDTTYGDGCSTVVLMLHAGLRRVTSQICSKQYPSKYQYQILRLSRTLQWIRKTWVAKEYIHAMTSSDMWSQSILRNDFQQTLRSVIRTNLAGKFGSGAVTILADVIREWILPTTTTTTTNNQITTNNNTTTTQNYPLDLHVLQQRIQHILHEWPLLKAPGSSLDTSQILDDEILITRPFFREQSWAKHNYKTVEGKAIRFVVVLGSFAPEQNSQLMNATKAETFQKDTNNNTMNQVIQCSSKWAKLCVDAISKTGIDLVVCTEAIPEEFASHFRRCHLLAIDHVEKREAMLLCNRANMKPIECGTPKTFHEIANQLKQCQQHPCIGNTTSVGRVTLGNINCVYFRGLYLSACQSNPGGQLLLRAGSDGIIRQYERAIRRCIVVVDYWLTTTFEDQNMAAVKNVKNGMGMPSVVLGGGKIEMASQIWCLAIAERSLSGGVLPSSLLLLVDQGILTRREIYDGMNVMADMFGSVPLALAKRMKGRARNRKEKGGGTLVYLEELAEKKMNLEKGMKMNNEIGADDVASLCNSPTRMDLVGGLKGGGGGPIETPSGRVANLTTAMDVLVGLMRVDDVVLVKSVKSMATSEGRRVKRTLSENEEDE